MKTKVLAVFCGALVLAAGCVSTVNDRSTAGVPFVKDWVEGQYKRPVDEVFGAAKAVVTNMGTLVNESTLYGQTNTVKTLEGRVNETHVWVRVEAVDPEVTLVVVQARTKAGGSYLDLAHEVEKQIGIKLATAR
jgi:hypothetical protein